MSAPALEAVPGKIVFPKNGGDRVGLHDLPHRLRRDSVLAELREGRGACAPPSF